MGVIVSRIGLDLSSLLLILVFEQLEAAEAARDSLQGCADEAKRLAAELVDREVRAPRKHDSDAVKGWSVRGMGYSLSWSLLSNEYVAGGYGQFTGGCC